jgi:hypothetical protein
MELMMSMGGVVMLYGVTRARFRKASRVVKRSSSGM